MLAEVQYNNTPSFDICFLFSFYQRLMTTQGCVSALALRAVLQTEKQVFCDISLSEEDLLPKDRMSATHLEVRFGGWDCQHILTLDSDSACYVLVK